MARKRRIQLTAEERHESEMYKRKLRSCKQELSSSSGLTNAAAAIDEQQFDVGRKKTSDKQELPSTSSSRLGDTAATGEPLTSDPVDAVTCDVPPQHEQPTVAAKRILVRPLPPLSLSEYEKRKYTFKSPYPQQFSVPENIIYYITQNVILYGSQRNLLQTCKLLFRMSRIISVLDVKNTDDSFVLSSCSHTPIRITYHAFQKLTIKFQVYGDISVGNEYDPYLASALVQRIHKCSPEFLSIIYQNLTFGEIQILASGNRLVKIDFTKNVVKNADGSITDFEKIFEAFLCVNMYFELPNENGIGMNTTKKMAELLESKGNLCRLFVGDVSEIFDGQLFVRSLNPDIISCIGIKFSDTISSTYKNQLRQFINQFYGNDVKPPISFSGLEDEDDQV